MLAIISNILDSKSTPDTGTAADGWHAVPTIDVRFGDQQKRRRSFDRDYAMDRKVQPQFIGHA